MSVKGCSTLDRAVIGVGLDMATGLGEAGAAVVITARREQWLATPTS